MDATYATSNDPATSPGAGSAANAAAPSDARTSWTSSNANVGSVLVRRRAQARANRSAVVGRQRARTYADTVSPAPVGVGASDTVARALPSEAQPAG